MLAIIWWVCQVDRAGATPASPWAFEDVQPDGGHVELHIRGDEFFHWLEDRRGFTVLRDRGWYVYGRRDAEGRLVPTTLRVGSDDPGAAGLGPRELPDPAFRNARRAAMQAGGEAASGPAAAGNWQGSLKNLVVLLRFSNHASRSVPSEQNVGTLMNAVGGDPVLAPTGSVRDCYLENSYGLLSLDSTVAYWIDLPNTEAYYANGDSGLTTRTHEALRHALNVLDADPNFHFSDYDLDNDGYIDAITFLHSGYGAEWGGTSADGAFYTDRIWSHKWAIFSPNWISSDGVRVYNYHISPAIWGTSGTNIGRIGVICHETGHFLGLPDLYDGGDSDGDGRAGSGIGSYGLMANSWGFDGSQLYPPHLSAWSKIQLGWMTPTLITGAGSYSLPQAQTSPSCYRVDLGYPSGEYLLIENRQPVGFDSAMPQGGLCIFHIDDAASYTNEGHPYQSTWPENGRHYRVALLQADGTYDLERGLDRGDRYDVYRGGGVSAIGPDTLPNTDAYQGGNVVVTNNRIFNISAAGSTMTFNFEVVGAGVPPEAPSQLAAAAFSHERIDLTWSDNSGTETGFHIERSDDGGASWPQVATVEANVTAFSDSGLSPSTPFLYRVRAYNSSGPSGYSNTASATTDPQPPPPAAPQDLAATALSDAAIRLTWTDVSDTEDGYHVDRSLDGTNWETAIASLPANSSSYDDSGLTGNTTYFYQVRPYDAWGGTPSNIASATTDPPPSFMDTHADQDWFVAGTVTGTFADTQTDDGIHQTIVEVESGGKPSLRHSFLDHRWRFSNVRVGLAVSLVADAYAPANAETDNFELEYSTNGGSSWSSFSPPLIIANGTSPGTIYAATFPAGTKGTVHIRVTDTDQTANNRAFDSISIDELFIRTELDPDDFPPAAPSAVTATIVSSNRVDISWTDNSTNEFGFEIRRAIEGSGFAVVGTVPANATSFSDLSAVPATTYVYQVAAYTASYEASSNSNPVTTPDGLAITGLTGGKQKGAIYVDLQWSGGASLATVNVLRRVNGGAWETIATVSNTGSKNYRDNTGLKGSATLTYRIESTDGTIVSNESSITF